MATRGGAMELRTELIGKLALAAIAGVLIGPFIRASARWLMRSLVFIGMLTALYFGARRLGSGKVKHWSLHAASRRHGVSRKRRSATSCRTATAAGAGVCLYEEEPRRNCCGKIVQEHCQSSGVSESVRRGSSPAQPWPRTRPCALLTPSGANPCPDAPGVIASAIGALQMALSLERVPCLPK